MRESRGGDVLRASNRDVLPRLLRALSAKDGRERAAARRRGGRHAAFTETRGARAALDAFIAAVRHGPGDGDDAGGDARGADDAEGSRAASVLRGWSVSLTEDQAREVAAGIAARDAS